MTYAIEMELTDETCVVEGATYSGIPVFFDEKGVIQPLTDYMIFLVRAERINPSSVETYAYSLQKFWKWLHAHSPAISWNKVTDDHLLLFRDTYRRADGKKCKDATVKSALEVIFQFYVWAETVNLIRNHVAIYDDKGDRVFHISAIRNHDGGRHEWSWPRLLSIRPKKPWRSTPTPNEIDDLHGTISESTKCIERDAVMARLMRESNMRIGSILSMLTRQVPSRDKIEEAKEANKAVPAIVRIKGGSEEPVAVLPELWEACRMYLEGERKRIVESARLRNPAYAAPKELFLSSKTGLALTRQGGSNRFIHLMRKAGMSGMSGHRIRARGLSDVVENERETETGRVLSDEQTLIRASAKANHRNPRSLEPYLTEVAKQKITVGDKYLRTTSKLRTAEGKLKAVESDLKNASALREIAMALRKGQRSVAARLAQQLAASIEGSVRKDR